jgi:hypothetical protein
MREIAFSSLFHLNFCIFAMSAIEKKKEVPAGTRLF